MDKISTFLADYCIRHSQVPREKREIYIYGFKLIFADIINFGIIILFGLYTAKLKESIIFLITLCGLRQYSGGFHAKTFLICRISMIITYVAVTVTTIFLESRKEVFFIVLILNIISTIFISILAPIENANKKLSIYQKSENKIKSIIASAVFSLGSTLLTVSNFKTEGVTISITILAVGILMVIGLVAKKGGDSGVQLVN